MGRGGNIQEQIVYGWTDEDDRFLKHFLIVAAIVLVGIGVLIGKFVF